MTKTDRPDYCCGRCPELARGGFDCTCRGNPRCKKNAAVDLQQVLDLDGQATAGPWEHVESALAVEQHYVIVEGIGPVAADTKPEDATLIAYYRAAAPAMAKALQAVLDLHAPMPCDPGCCNNLLCKACIDEYPCPTVKAIHKHLGEQQCS